MKPREFYDTVVKMRTAQKKIQESESQENLEECLKYENIIDLEIERVEMYLQVQNKLPKLDLVPVKYIRNYDPK